MDYPDSRPTIKTERLLLRPLQISDGWDVRRMAGNSKVAVNTLYMPFPYPEEVAEEWISTHATEFFEKKQLILGIALKSSKELLGCIGLTMKTDIENAELGYWIGEPYWNQGYATEAARAIIDFGFQSLGLHKIYANYFSNNAASGRVMEKIGMVQEGYLRQHVRHWGEYKDLYVFGIVKPAI
ncbi:MAG: GNAT family N-acetyltransferase [Bacteroidetes bacterium]|nr:GNAT family N-acetyltransferase [Bacteroidota bacterium]